MDQHVLKIKVLEEIELLNGHPARYSRFPWVLPEDADEAYFEFYMPSYNKAYSETCGYAGDTHDPTTQIARPPYYWDAEMGKWYSSGPIPHAPTNSELVYDMNEDFSDNSFCDSDSCDEQIDFEVNHHLELLDMMGGDVFVNWLDLIDDLDVVFASRGARGILTPSSPATPHDPSTAITHSSPQWRLKCPHFSYMVVSEMMVLFALHGAENILRSAPRRKTHLL